MTERRKQTEFLKTLVHCADSPERPQLLERMLKAEHDERCLARAIKLVALVGILAATALAYSTLLDNNPPAHSGPSAVDQLFAALALGASVCMASFLAGWIYYRALTNQISKECRRFVISVVEGRNPARPATTSLPRRLEQPVQTAVAADHASASLADSFVEMRHAI